MIKLNINTSKIDKSLMFVGKTGNAFLDLVLFDNKDGQDKYGNDGYVVQDVTKEARLAGKRGPIVGNWKTLGASKTSSLPKEANQSEDANSDDIPF